MLALLSLCESLSLPASSTGGNGLVGTATRRTALENAASAALLPLFASPLAASAVIGDSNEIGYNGALRADIPPSIVGDGVEIIVTDQTYKELSTCPPNFFVPAKGGPWTCLEISVTATNNGRRKQTTAVDIFGFMFDNEGFACLSTALDPTVKGSPVATLEVNIPKGEKRTLTFNAAVQSRSPRPLRFGGWKGSYRAGGVAKTFQAFDPCEVDSTQCDDPLDQPENFKQGLVGKGNNYRSSDVK